MNFFQRMKSTRRRLYLNKRQSSDPPFTGLRNVYGQEAIKIFRTNTVSAITLAVRLQHIHTLLENPMKQVAHMKAKKQNAKIDQKSCFDKLELIKNGCRIK